jgi:prepilin-type N-terminal cleavage/methylation domain-containing protein
MLNLIHYLIKSRSYETLKQVQGDKKGVFQQSAKSSISNPPSPPFTKGLGGIMGFTLLEVLVATAILGIAVTVVLQLFSANLRAISASGDYVSAATKAGVKMREILSYDKLQEKSFSEVTDDGYRMEVSITDTLKERTENLQVRLLEINLTIQWMTGTKERALTLRTMKVVEKEI